MKSAKKTLLALSFIGALIAGYAPESAAADVVKLKTMAAHSQATAWAWPVYEKWIEAVKRKRTQSRARILCAGATGSVHPVSRGRPGGIADIVLVAPAITRTNFH